MKRFDNIFVQLMNLGTGRVNECVTENEDGSYTIFINDSLSPSAKREAYLHALKHIEMGHFDLNDANRSEWEAHA